MRTLGVFADYIITMNPYDRIIKDGVVVVQDDKIVDIGKREIAKNYRFDQKIDTKGKLLMPGLILTHTHAAMTLFRGIADDMPLMEWLTKHIWPREQNLRPVDVYHGTLLACAEMIRNGVTCFGDMYFFTEHAAKAVMESGMRGVLSAAVVNTLPEEFAGINVAKKQLAHIKNLKSDKVIPWLGPHSVYACDEDVLKEIRELAYGENVKINIHACETKEELMNVRNQTGKTPIEFLESIKFLDSDVTIAHCVWPTEYELNILKERNVKISHNACSNMKLASGVAPVPEMIEKNIYVNVGTDGAASNNSLDVLQEMKFISLIHKVNKMDPAVMKAQKILEMSTIDGARTFGLENQIGSLEIGKKADMIILDLNKPHLQPLHSDYTLKSHIIFSAVGGDVETVIVGGEIMMGNRRLTNLKEWEIFEKVKESVEYLNNKPL